MELFLGYESVFLKAATGSELVQTSGSLSLTHFYLKGKKNVITKNNNRSLVPKPKHPVPKCTISIHTCLNKSIYSFYYSFIAFNANA